MMKFRELARLFNKLTSTTKRLEMTDILTNFLKKISCRNIGFITLLCMGRIFPSNDSKDLGIGKKMMMEALSLSSGLSKKKIKKVWKEKGDMGEAGMQIMNNKKQSTLFEQEELTIDKLRNTLYKIPSVTGKGSVDLKLKMLSELLTSCSESEVLYLIRIILGNMRTGVGEGIIRNALSQAFDINAKKIEDAYNMSTNYSFIAEKLCRNPESIENIGINLFTPINAMLFQKAESIEESFEKVGRPAIIEIKYDGIRAQIHKKDDEVRIFTRNLDEVTRQFPDIIKFVKKNVLSRNCIIEAEIIAYNPENKKILPFQTLSRRIKRKYNIKKTIKEIPVKVFCFDILYNNNKSLLDASFETRHKLLEKIISSSDNIMLAEGVNTGDDDEAEKIFKKGIGEHEGVIFKNLKASYQPGKRVGYGVKLKTHMTDLDLVIVEAYYGKGRRRDWLGSFTLACYDKEKGEFLTVGKLGTGFSDEQLEKISSMLKPLIVKDTSTKVVVKPEVVVQVEYEEIQKSPTYSSGYALRFPRLVRIRFDKKPGEANTLSCVKELAGK